VKPGPFTTRPQRLSRRITHSESNRPQDCDSSGLVSLLHAAPVQIVIVARVKRQEEENVAGADPRRRRVSEGLFSLMREGEHKMLDETLQKASRKKKRGAKPTEKTQE
jgi:hypothetical protein